MVKYIFLIALVGFWIFALFGLWGLKNWQAEFDADQAAIARGEATEHEYTLTEKLRQNSSDDTRHIIILEGPKRISRDLTITEWHERKIGEKYNAYHVNDRVRVPEFDIGNYEDGIKAIKVVMTLFTLLVAILFVVDAFRKRKRPVLIG